jgi:hypothetical protein
MTHESHPGQQTPWLRQQSIRENILMYKPYDATFYAQVVKACALEPDFQVREDLEQFENKLLD